MYIQPTQPCPQTPTPKHQPRDPNPPTETPRPLVRKLSIYSQIMIVNTIYYSCLHMKSGVICPWQSFFQGLFFYIYQEIPYPKEPLPRPQPQNPDPQSTINEQIEKKIVKNNPGKKYSLPLSRSLVDRNVRHYGCTGNTWRE